MLFRSQFLAGDTVALERVRAALPAARALPQAQLAAHRLTVDEAQRTVAVEHRYATWSALVA